MPISFMEQFEAARRVSVPLVAIQTPDPASTILGIAERLAELKQPAGLLSWDIASGMSAINKPDGENVLKALFPSRDDDPSMLTNPSEALLRILKAPKGTIVFFHNIQRMMNETVIQGIWNIRDNFKENLRMLVMLCPSMVLPPELAQDVLVLDEPLPSAAKLGSIIADTYEGAKLPKPKVEDVTKAVDAICGLASFSAEQVCAMSVRRDGLNMEQLWERKRQQIEQTPGLSVWRGGERFTDIGGCDNVKRFLSRLRDGKEKPRAIVFQDEIEKAFAGAAGDLSGTTQELLGYQLSFMQDKNAKGLLFIGHPGAAKSAIAKAAGNEAGIPTIQFDLGGMKGSLVGESNSNMRTGLKVVEAVSQGRALFIATCNSIENLPPELRRRFSFGTFFFDLPTAANRELIWKIYMEKWGIKEQERPSDRGWTGAEIKNCCDIADKLNTTLIDAASYIVPLATSASERITNLRKQADGRFIDANASGVYKAPKDMEEVEEPPEVVGVVIARKPSRKIDMGGGSGGKDAN